LNIFLSLKLKRKFKTWESGIDSCYKTSKEFQIFLQHIKEQTNFILNFWDINFVNKIWIYFWVWNSNGSSKSENQALTVATKQVRNFKYFCQHIKGQSNFILNFWDINLSKIWQILDYRDFLWRLLTTVYFELGLCE
jgi:hypothetical protein